MQTKSTSRTAQVPKISKVPVFLKPLALVVNALSDFAGLNRPLPGPGVRITESQQGAVITLDPQLLQLLKEYQSGKTNKDSIYAPGNSTSWGTGGGGTGLPDTGVDPVTGQPTDPDGNLLAWIILNVCVSDGAGGWTPMHLQLYAALYA